MTESKSPAAKEVWITGIGIVSSLGEGLDAHWDALNQKRINTEAQRFAPYIVHPLAPVSFDAQIPKRGDQRQMEAWQRIGTYAAGLALENAGLKGHPDLLARTDMIVAASGGERDIAVDGAVLSNKTKSANPGVFLNERLMSDLRPTLFLAQLSNLLAGNISIVHGVTGSSRTFMGEEAAGVDAVRIALARITAGQSELALVGGSHNAKPLARLSGVLSERSDRSAGAIPAALTRMWQRLVPPPVPAGIAVISGATGAQPASGEERAWLKTLPDVPVRATGSILGHGFEPQFAMNIAFAALALGRKKLFPAVDSSGIEQEYEGPLERVAVTAVGHWRGEGMALIEAVT